jgi:UDP:flavonoid glycosyltransferase YjiC (YdhE family)
VSGVRILFVTWDGGGNVNPLLALGPRLAARGWDVHAFGPPSLAERFAAEGIAYAARDAADPWDPTAMAIDVRDEIVRTGADAVLVDYMLPGALCGAESTGRPTAALVHTLYRALLDAGIGGAPGPMAMAASVDGVNAARRGLGLDDVTDLGDLLRRCSRVLVSSPEELDTPASAGAEADADADPDPGNVRYVGALLEPAGTDAGWAPPPGTPGTPGRPRVVVSLGTTPMDEAPVLERVLAALADLPVDVVATVGAHLDPAEIAAAAPPNATVTGYVRHAALLPNASLLVTHAGLGTVLAGLAHGVPMVCLPLGRDQPANAAAVARVGAGRVVAHDAPVDALRAALADVLRSPTYRSAATALATTADGRTDAAADELEALLPTRVDPGT